MNSAEAIWMRYGRKMGWSLKWCENLVEEYEEYKNEREEEWDNNAEEVKEV